MKFNSGEVERKFAVIPVWPITPWGSSSMSGAGTGKGGAGATGGAAGGGAAGGGGNGGGRGETGGTMMFKEIKLELRAKPDDAKSHKFGAYFKVFETGTPEQWCRWRDDLERVWTGLNNTNGSGKAATVRLLLDGQARDDFNTYIDAHSESEDDVKEALKVVAINIFPAEAVLTQRRYLEYEAKKPTALSARELGTRLNLLNAWFDYYPSDGGARLDMVPRIQLKDLGAIYFRMLPVSWRRKMDENGFSKYKSGDTALRDTVEYAERLEVTEHRYGSDGNPRRGNAGRINGPMMGRVRGNANGGPELGNAMHGGNRDLINHNPRNNRDCLIHGPGCGHGTHQCKVIIPFAEKSKAIYATQKKYGTSNPSKPSSFAAHRKTQHYKPGKRSDDREYQRKDLQLMYTKMYNHAKNELKKNKNENHNIEEFDVEKFLDDTEMNEISESMEEMFNN